MINVALLSKWHVHAEDYAEQAERNTELSIKMVWDEDIDRGKTWASQLNVPFEENLEAVLTSSEIDAVIVTAPTSLHKEIILAAARNQKHIFTEKVLAFSAADCEDILQAVHENKVRLTLSLPRLSEPYYLYAQTVVDQGLLGKVTSIRCRVAHNGAVPTEEHPTGWLPEHFFSKEQCGGGALIDLGAHPIYLTNRLAGKAEAVTAILKQTMGHDVDDNALVAVEYESGALGTIETGFLAYGSPSKLEIYGTEGTLLIEDNLIRYKNKQTAGQWKTPEVLPEPLPMPMEQWVNAIERNEPSFITEEDIIRLTIMNEAAALSNKEKRRIELKETAVY